MGGVKEHQLQKTLQSEIKHLRLLWILTW